MLPIYQKVEDYLETKRGLWSETTVRSCRSYLKNAVVLARTLHPRELFDALKENGVSLYYIKIYMTVVSGFERFLLGTDEIKLFLRDNAFHFRNAYQEKTKRMTDEDFERILKSAPDAAVHNLLVLLGQCGLRKHEALKALWSDFDPQTNILKVLGKGGKVRHVPLSMDWLRSTAPSSGISALFEGGKSPRCFIEATGFGFIDFRSYFATKVANNPELNIKDAQMLLGHSHISTTMRYIRVDQNRVHQVLMKGWKTSFAAR